MTPAKPSPVATISAAGGEQDAAAAEPMTQEADRQGQRRRAEQRAGDRRADRGTVRKAEVAMR